MHALRRHRLGLLSKGSKDGIDSGLTLDFHLSQERLADMLGISRQWATKVVRELAQAGLVQWRYGRVTVLDVQALRALAAKTAAVACGADAGGGTTHRSN
jgi:CRP-like cAMP-binding protein